MRPQSNPPIPDQIPAGLVRISVAARFANLRPEVFREGIANGSIPLETIPIGPRLRFVRGQELSAWLNGKS